MKLFLLLIIFFMLNVVISCGENTNKTEKKLSCENVDCGMGYCKIINGKANCECNMGYHNDNLNCLRNILTKEDIISACEKITPCKTGGEEDIDLCVAKYNSFYHSEKGSIYAYYMPIKEKVNDYILCINSHDTCDEYNFCFNNFMGITYSNEVCDNIEQTCSDDTTLKVCENGKYEITNCTVINKKCLEYGNKKAICSNDTICDSNTFENYCNDNGSLVYCKNGITQEYYCPYYGMECRIDNNTPNCYLKDNTESCEENNKTSCENGNMVLCRNNKKLITSCSELFGENFKCLNFKYKSGDFIKDTYGCFFE